MKWSHPAVALTAIALVSIACYVNALPNALITDDLELIEEHPSLGAPQDLAAVFAGASWGGNASLFRPLTLWTYSLDFRVNRWFGLQGRHTAVYHLVNLLLHAAVGCCLYLLLRRLQVAAGASIIAALLFAVHPLHTEPVVTLVGRAELLAALFGLLFLLLHHAGHPTAGGICYALALCSKESGIAFLGLAVWMDLCFGRRRSIARFAGYGLVLGAWLGVRAWALPASRADVPFIDNPLSMATLAERVLTAARVQLDYLRLLILPVGLSSDYSYDQIPVAPVLAGPRAAGFALIALGAAALAWYVRKSHPIVPFSVGGYAMLFFLTSNVPLSIGTIMGERLAYAPSLCACALLGYGGWLLAPRLGRTAPVCLILILAALGSLAIARNRTWRDVGAHVRAQVASAPRSAKAHLNMAVYEQERGALDSARAECEEALSIFPQYAEAWNRLGLIRSEAGDLDGAIAAHLEAVRIFPEYAAAWSGLGAARVNRGDPTSGVAAYLRAIDQQPGSARYRYQLGQALQATGQIEGAIEAYRKAIDLQPDFAPPYVNLGTIEASRGQLQEARTLWERALTLDPGYELARKNLELLRALERER